MYNMNYVGENWGFLSDSVGFSLEKVYRSIHNE